MIETKILLGSKPTVINDMNNLINAFGHKAPAHSETKEVNSIHSLFQLGLK
jgi:hypothetical protein